MNFSVSPVSSAFSVPVPKGQKRPISAVGNNPDDAIRSLNRLIQKQWVGVLCQGSDWIDSGTGYVRVDLPNTPATYKGLREFCKLISEFNLGSEETVLANTLVGVFSALEESATNSPPFTYNLETAMAQLAGPTRDKTLEQLRDYFVSGIPSTAEPGAVASLGFAFAGDMRRQREGELVRFAGTMLASNDLAGLTEVVPGFLASKKLLPARFACAVAAINTLLKHEEVGSLAAAVELVWVHENRVVGGLDMTQENLQLMIDFFDMATDLDGFSPEQTNAIRALEVLKTTMGIKEDPYTVIQRRNSTEILELMGSLSAQEQVGVFVDMAIRSPALARDWIRLTPELVNVILECPDEKGELWGALNTAMTTFISDVRMGEPHAKNKDVVGAIYAEIVGRNEDGLLLEKRSDRLSEPALKTLLTYCCERRSMATFLKVVCSATNPKTSCLWAAATDRFHMIDPADPVFVAKATRIAVTPTPQSYGDSWEPVAILGYVNPKLLEFHSFITQIISSEIPTDVDNLGDLKTLLEAVKCWDSDVLKINLLGTSGANFLVELAQKIEDPREDLRLRQSISNLFVAVVERPGDTIRVHAKGEPISGASFLMEKLMVSQLSVSTVLESAMPIVYREMSSICTTRVPVPFNAVAWLDPIATRTLLTAFPLAIRQVADNQMTIAHMAIKGLRDGLSRIQGAPDFSEQRRGLIDRFKSVFELCLDFGDLSGVDLRHPLVANSAGTESSPFTPKDYVDVFLKGCLTSRELADVARLLERPAHTADTAFGPEFLARVGVSFPSFLGDIRQEVNRSGNRDGIFTADIDPQTQFAVVRRLGTDDHVDGRLLGRPTPESAELDLPMSVNIRYQSMIAQSIQLISQIESGDLAGIARGNTLLDEYVAALPGRPSFSPFFIVNSLFLNTQLTSTLCGQPEGTPAHQLGHRLVTLGRLVVGMELFNGVVGNEATPLAEAVKRVNVRPETRSSTLVSIGTVEPHVRKAAHSIYERLADLPTVLFSAEVQTLLTDIDVSGTVGVVAIPHVDDAGRILVGLRRAGGAQVFGRQHGGEFSPIFDAELDVQLRTELHQIVVFPEETGEPEVARILRFVTATAPENGEDVGAILKKSVAVMDIQGVIERCTGKHREISAQGQDRSYVVDGRFQVALGADEGVSPDGSAGLSVIQSLLHEESPAVRLSSRFQALLTDDSAVFYRVSVQNLAKQLGMSVDRDSASLAGSIVAGLEGNIVAGLEGNQVPQFEAAVSLLSILSGQSLGVLNLRSRHPRSTIIGNLSGKTPVVVWGSGPVRVVAATELPENLTVSSDSDEDYAPDSVSTRGALGSVVGPSNLATIVTGPGGNTCWLESLVNIEAEQLRTAIGQTIDYYPPVTRMILEGLPGVNMDMVTPEDRPKIEWMLQFLRFGADLNQAQPGTPVAIDGLAVGWERAFGQRLYSNQEADLVANTVYDTLSKYSHRRDSVDVTVGLYSHPFGSIDAVRGRLDLQTRVAPYPGADSTVVRVRTAEAAPVLSCGVLEMNVQPDTLFWETQATAAREGLGFPVDDRVVRLAESRLPFSVHRSRLPATLQFRFGTFGTHLNPSGFNPHRLNQSLVFQRGGALYAVSSLLGRPAGHWVSLFADTVLPVDERAPVFYEKLHNGSNAVGLPLMTWSTAVERYFSRYPSVVIRASRVPDHHSLYADATAAGLLTYSHDEQVLRTVVADLLPDMGTAEGDGLFVAPENWEGYIACVAGHAARLGERGGV